MPTTPFPHHYEVVLEQDQILAPPRQPVRIGPPPQFGGTALVWSPEELLLGAVLSCIKTTFDAYARGKRLAIRGWYGRIAGTLDRGATTPQFTSISVSLHIAADIADEAAVFEVVDRVKRTCIISNALKVPVEIGAIVTTSEAADIAC